MEEEDIKNFWIDGIRVPDKSGNIKGNRIAGYDGRIKITMGKPTREHKNGDWKMAFKTVISDHVHSKLNGRTITRIRRGFADDAETISYENLSKTISAYSLERLIEIYDEYIDDYTFIIDDERRPKEKFLYVKWQHKAGDTKSSGNSAKMGKRVYLKFHFFVGYYNGVTHFDVDYRAFNVVSYDKEILEYKRIPWTQERESFFEGVYAHFESFEGKLTDFFDKLNPKLIDDHVNATALLQLSKKFP